MTSMSFNIDKMISPFIKALPPSGLAKFLEITANNPNIVPLSVGEPDFDIPAKVRAACIDSLNAGKSNYTSTLGMLELREAIAADTYKNYGVQYDPKTEIMVTVGVSEALDVVIRTIMVPDGEIIIPEPCYVANKACIILAGGKPVPVETKLENGFVPTVTDLEKAVTDKTRAILLGYPNNPTGAIMSKEQIKAIGDWAVKHDIMIISDELYAHLTYGGKKHTMFTAFPEFKDRTVVLNGFSKAYAMTGLRLGYFTAPAAFVQAANLLHQNVVLCANITAQYGAIAALKYCENDMLAMVAEYEKRRQIMIDGFKKIGLNQKVPFMYSPVLNKQGSRVWNLLKNCLQKKKCWLSPAAASDPAVKALSAVLMLTAKIICGKH